MVHRIIIVDTYYTHIGCASNIYCTYVLMYVLLSHSPRIIVPSSITPLSTVQYYSTVQILDTYGVEASSNKALSSTSLLPGYYTTLSAVFATTRSFKSTLQASPATTISPPTTAQQHHSATAQSAGKRKCM